MRVVKKSSILDAWQGSETASDGSNQITTELLNNSPWQFLFCETILKFEKQEWFFVKFFHICDLFSVCSWVTFLCNHHTLFVTVCVTLSPCRHWQNIEGETGTRIAERTESKRQYTWYLSKCECIWTLYYDFVKSSLLILRFLML